MNIKFVVEKLRQYFFRFRGYELAHRLRIRFLVFAALFLLFLFYQFFLKAPAEFPASDMVRVEKGLGLKEISAGLYEKKVIKSPVLFKIYAYLLRSDKRVVAGDYLFTEAAALPRVVWRLTQGEFNLTPVKVTIPEGATLSKIAAIFEKEIPLFDRSKFLAETKGKEGYLFPDTYLFFPNVSTGEIITDLENNFNKKMETLKDDVTKSGHSISDIITMASILEHEARTSDDRKIIAGILWKRIQIGMALQVDAPFVYESGKGTYSLTTKDLKTDSPYNTYTRRGLPAGPIGNPGLDSILAAIYPKDSPYLYYLSDREGNVYYSATFDKHKKNKVLYIN
ncbi:MAG: endolytic transglycosylase MltG [Patescibacteria group bacterium]